MNAVMHFEFTQSCSDKISVSESYDMEANQAKQQMSKRLMSGLSALTLTTYLFFPQVIQAQATDVNTFLGNVDVGNDIRVMLAPEKQAVISSLITSRITKIHVRDGDTIKKGTPLFDFSCKQEWAQKKVEEAKLVQYQTTYQSNVKLIERDAVSRYELELSQAKTQEGEANLSVIRAKLSNCRITAPYSAKVVRVFVNQYENVATGTELVSIINDSKLKMVLNIPSKYATSVKSKMKFDVHIDETNSRHEAVVRSISPAIDAASRTLAIVAEISGDSDALKPGMSGRAFLETLE